MFQSISIPKSTGECKREFPAKKWNFALEIEGDPKGAQIAWEGLKKIEIDGNDEKSLCEPFADLLKHLTKGNVWWDESKNRMKRNFIPDVVIYSEDTPFDPVKNRNRILLDVELKRKFNTKTENMTNQKTEKYPGNTSEAYLQLLNRTEQARPDFSDPYFFVVCDFKSIIFWKAVRTRKTIETHFYGPLAFGGKWTLDNQNWTITFPQMKSDEVPVGFSALISLLKFINTPKQPIHIINDMGKIHEVYPSRTLGRGRRSIVYSVKYCNDSICLKLEPLGDNKQLLNEIEVLSKLSSCQGVPKVLFYGETLLHNRKWSALATDIVADYTLSSIPKLQVNELEDIAMKAIDILCKIHTKGIIHRDIKPDHLAIYNENLYLLDFGAAGTPDSVCNFRTKTYASIKSSISMNDEESDFESLWYSLLSKCEKLPWEDIRDDLEVFWQKMKYSPTHLEEKYPTLSQLFQPYLHYF